MKIDKYYSMHPTSTVYISVKSGKTNLALKNKCYKINNIIYY